jgi:hypothetical protein
LADAARRFVTPASMTLSIAVLLAIERNRFDPQRARAQIERPPRNLIAAVDSAVHRCVAEPTTAPPSEIRTSVRFPSTPRPDSTTRAAPAADRWPPGQHDGLHTDIRCCVHFCNDHGDRARHFPFGVDRAIGDGDAVFVNGAWKANAILNARYQLASAQLGFQGRIDRCRRMCREIDHNYGAFV